MGNAIDGRLSSMTDAQLALRAQGGDRDAFACLAERWGGRLCGFLERLLGDPEEARDTCQEALLKAYVNIGRLREPAHFKAWIHQIAVNLGRDRGRAQRSRPTISIEEMSDEHRPRKVEAAQIAEAAVTAETLDLRGILDRALARLPVEQRTAILLREVEGFTSEEIGRITGVSGTTVRSRIFHGLRALRRMLPEYGVTAGHLQGMGAET